MALSNTEKQKTFRQRKAEAGESEVRGVFARTDLHPEIKAKIKRMIKKMAVKND